MSSPFSILSGVRQGGILSPILFAVYFDSLVDRLSMSKLGCSINGQYLGCLLYADDILLLSQSVSCMQRMLDICTDVSHELDLKFNVQKSMVLRIGSRFKRKCELLILDGQNLDYVSEFKYLRVFVQSGNYFTCSLNHTKLKFYRCFNSIYNKAKSASSEIICINLLKSQCLPLILYATEAISPSARDMLVLDKLINRAVSKIFNTFDPTIISDMRCLFDLVPIADTVRRRELTFVKKYMYYMSKNFYLLHCVYSCCRANDIF